MRAEAGPPARVLFWHDTQLSEQRHEIFFAQFLLPISRLADVVKQPTRFWAQLVRLLVQLARYQVSLGLMLSDFAIWESLSEDVHQ